VASLSLSFGSSYLSPTYSPTLPCYLVLDLLCCMKHYFEEATDTWLCISKMQFLIFEMIFDLTKPAVWVLDLRLLSRGLLLRAKI
jgi:hypothetical protein